MITVVCVVIDMVPLLWHIATRLCTENTNIFYLLPTAMKFMCMVLVKKNKVYHAYTHHSLSPTKYDPFLNNAQSRCV